MIHGDLQALGQLLLVTPTQGTFSGGHPPDNRHRVYGGQFLGQGLVAGCWGQPLPVRSFHASFIRAGTPEASVDYRVSGDPGSSRFRTVTASQAGRLLFVMDLHLGQPLAAAAVHPPASTPAAAIPREIGISGLDTGTEASWAVTDSPFDNHFVENVWDAAYRAPDHQVWFRGRGNSVLPADTPITGAQLHQAMLAYYSDDTVMDNALFPHGWMTNALTLQTASLDHCMWFHDNFAFDQWLLFQQDSPVASGARGMTRGRILRSDGGLIASVCQEIFMRPMRTAAGDPG